MEDYGTKAFQDEIRYYRAQVNRLKSYNERLLAEKKAQKAEDEFTISSLRQKIKDYQKMLYRLFGKECLDECEIFASYDVEKNTTAKQQPNVNEFTAYSQKES